MIEKKTLLEEYFEYLDFYQKKFGQNTIILIQVGSFYEVYGVNNETEKIGNVELVSELLNIQLTRKNKNNINNNRENPLLCGIPISSYKRHLDTICKLNKYTLVIINQVTPPPNPKREVVEILSPGTYIENYSVETNNLISIFIEKEYLDEISIGCSLIDLSTGKNSIIEFFSTENDKELAIDELYRFIKTNNPKEIIISSNSYILDKNLIKRLEIDNIPYHLFNNLDSVIFKISYQNELLGNFFENKTMLSNIEFLELEKKQIGTISYIKLLIFIYEHNENILNNIEKPEILENDSNLILTTNSINQLNLINNNFLETNGNINSLFDVLDKTKTSMGKRLLKYRLLNPILSKEELNNRYSEIESLKDNFKLVDEFLSQIKDLEKLHRKIALKNLQPIDFPNLDSSYKSVLNLINLLKLNESFNKKLLTSEVVDIINDYEKIFDINEMNKYLINDIDGSFLKKGTLKKVDELDNLIFNNMQKLNQIAINLNGKLDYTDRDGYFIIVTNGKLKDIDINELNETKLKNGSKIKNNEIENLSNIIFNLKNEIRKLMKDYYLTYLDYFYTKYETNLKKIVNFISILDVSSSNLKCSLEYKYSKPTILGNKSFLEINDLRHPLIERLSENTEYVSNDIVLNNNSKGILLYGTNASGKSSLMKAIGICIIMAQAGMFVPCNNMKYGIFKSIYTRIDGGDNIFKGLSTFAVEMLELRNILSRSNEFSLVLGDEISHGTESISALSIVASSIIQLYKKNVYFVFATHLHELSKMELITNIKEIKHFHLKVLFDEQTGKLFFDRKLAIGAGSAIYGLEVAKSFQMDKDFLKLAQEIRKDIIGKNKLDLLINNPKTSKYNNNIFLTKCSLCENDAEEVHHIKEQNKFSIFDKNKNKKYNLLPLCSNCHNLIHNYSKKYNKNCEELISYTTTSDGIELKMEEDLKKELKII